MPSLVAYAVVKRSYTSLRLKRSLVLALLLSWAGDVLLTQSGEVFFMAGLSAFLLAHITYVYAYGYSSANYPLKVVWRRWWYWVPIVGYGFSFYAWLFPKIGPDLHVAVGAYSLVLVSMLLAAAGRGKYTHPTSFIFVGIGATLFVVSDSLIAVNRFVEPLQNGQLQIMLTYILGQWLITEGLLRHPSPVDP